MSCHPEPFDSGFAYAQDRLRCAKSRDYIPALLAAVAVALTSSCAKPQTPNQTAAPNVSIVHATEGTIAVTIPAVGRIGGAAGAQTKLSFPMAGRLASVDVHVGDRVDAGQAVAALDTRSLALSAVAASADARSAAVDKTSTRIAVDTAELSRVQRLYGAGVMARKDVDAARAQLAADRADRATAQADLAGAQARAGVAQRELQNATLLSPIAGTVTAVYVLPGEGVDASTAVVAITPQSTGELTLDVSGTDALRITPGDVVNVHAGSAAFSGTVSGVSSALDPSTQSAQVLARVAMPGSLAGGSVDAEIVVAHDRGIIIPKRAIIADPSTSKTLVFVQSKNKDGSTKFDERDVTVVFQNETQAEVTGLRSGEAVASTGAFELLPPAGGD